MTVAQKKKLGRQEIAELYIRICTEIELITKNDNLNLHKKVKELTDINRPKKGGILHSKNDNIIPNFQSELAKWKEYIQELFKDKKHKHYIEDLTSEGGSNI